MTAAEISQQAAKVYLNDSAQSTWTDAVLLPCVIQSSEELEKLLIANDIPVIKDVSIVIAVAIAAVVISLPTDLLEPLALSERTSGSSDKFKEVKEVDFLDPNLTTESTVIQWAWYDQQIHINAPTTARECLLKYHKSLTAITATSSIVELPRAKNFMSARTAQLAARNLGNNPTKADAMQPDINEAKALLIGALVKNNQGAGGARRRGYKGARTLRIV